MVKILRLWAVLLSIRHDMSLPPPRPEKPVPQLWSGCNRKEGRNPFEFSIFFKAIDPRSLSSSPEDQYFFCCVFRIVVKLWAKRSVENLRGIFLESFKRGPRRRKDFQFVVLARGCKYLTVSQKESDERKKYIYIRESERQSRSL